MSHKVKITPAKRALSLLLAVMFIISGLSLEVFAADMDSGDVEIISEDDGSNSVHVDAAEPEVVSSADLQPNEIQEVIDAADDEPVCEACQTSEDSTGPPVVKLMGTENGSMYFEDDLMNPVRSFDPGDEVAIGVMLDDGFAVRQFAVTEDKDGGEIIDAWTQSGASLTFTMPAYDVRVYVLIERGEMDSDLVPLSEQLDVQDIATSDPFIFEDYIRTHLNADYVDPSAPDFDLENGSAWDWMLVVQTWVDGDWDNPKLKDLDITDSSQLDEDILQAHVYNQIDTHTVLFDVDSDSDYFVGFAYDVVANADVRSYCDVEIGYNNLQGERITDAFYDAETGLIYIPKKYREEDKNGEGFGNVKAQILLQSLESDVSYSYAVPVSVSGNVGNLSDSGYIFGHTLDTSVAVQLFGEGYEFGDVEFDDITVKINGYDAGRPMNMWADDEADGIFSEDGLWAFDPVEGYIVFDCSVIDVWSIEIDVTKPAAEIGTGAILDDTWGSLYLFKKAYKNGKRNARIYSRLNTGWWGTRPQGTLNYSFDQLDITDGLVNVNYAAIQGQVNRDQYNAMYDEFMYWDFPAGEVAEKFLKIDYKGNVNNIYFTEPILVYQDLTVSGANGGGTDAKITAVRMSAPYMGQWYSNNNGYTNGYFGDVNGDMTNAPLGSWAKTMSVSVWNGSVKTWKFGMHTSGELGNSHTILMNGGTVTMEREAKATGGAKKVKVQLPGGAKNYKTWHRGVEWDNSLALKTAYMQYNLSCGHLYQMAWEVKEYAYGIWPQNLSTTQLAGGAFGHQCTVMNRLRLNVYDVETLGTYKDKYGTTYKRGTMIICCFIPIVNGQFGVGIHKVAWRTPITETTGIWSEPDTAPDTSTPKDARIKVSLQKVDQDGNPIQGVKFKLQYKSGRTTINPTIGGANEWATGADGRIELDLTDYLKATGSSTKTTWMWVETQPLDGYVFTGSAPTFKIEKLPHELDGDTEIPTITVVAKNKLKIDVPEFAPLCFNKKSMYPQITSCNSAYSLAGARYRLTVNITDEWTIKKLDLDDPHILTEEAVTDDNGRICFHGIEKGKLELDYDDEYAGMSNVGYPMGSTWTLEELTPPSYGYLRNPETLTGTINQSWKLGSGDLYPDYDDHLDEPFYDVDLVVEKYDDELKDMSNPDEPTYAEDNLHPSGGTVGKVDVNYAQGEAHLEGALFEFSFYVGQLDRQAIARANGNTADGSPLFRFVLPTYLMANGKVGININDVDNQVRVQNWEYHCAGDKQYDFDDFYNDALGKFMWPAGTLAIREVDPPEGYKKGYTMAQWEDGKVINGPYKDDMIILHIDDTLKATADTTDPILHCLYGVTVEETDIIEGGPQIWKHDYNRIENIDATNGKELRDTYDIDEKAWSTHAQGNASLAGAVFEIINNSANAVVVNGRTYPKGAVVGKMVTDEKGYAEYTPKDLPYGFYLIREVQAPKGYGIGVSDEGLIDHTDPWGYAAQQRGEWIPGSQDVLTYRVSYKNLEPGVSYVIDGTVLVNGNPVDYRGVPLSVSEQFTVPDSEGFIDIQFKYDSWIRYQEQGKGEYTIRIDSISKLVNEVDTGFTYVNPVIDEGAEDDYLDLSTSVLDELVIGDEKWVPIRQYVQKDGSKDKIQLTVVLDDAMDYSGETPVGLDLSKLDVSALSNSHGLSDIRLSTAKTPALGRIEKNDDGTNVDAGLVMTKGVVDATDGIVNMDIMVGTNVMWSFEIHVLTKSQVAQLDMGSVIVSFELQPGSLVYQAWAAEFRITEDGKFVKVNDWNKHPVLERIWRGGFKFSKIDCPTKLSEAEGDGDLNAHFGVINRSKEDVYVNGAWYAPGEQCFDFWTDKDTGYYTSTNNLLPYGSYEIVELEPSTGYLLNEGYSKMFMIIDDGQVIDLSSDPVCETPIRGDVQLVKYDYDMQKSESMNGASLAGISFELYNRSEYHVLYKGALYVPGALMDTLKTHWNEEVKAYTAETTGNALPYGTYGLKEIGFTDAKGNFVATNNKYLVLDKDEALFQIRNQGEKVTYGWMRKVDQNTRPTVTDDDVITGTRYEELDKLYPKDSVDLAGYEKSFLRWFNKIPRGDIQFNKRAEDTQKGMKTAWLVTSIWNPHESVGTKPKDPEQHIIITDDNGRFDSNERKYEGIAHEWETNGNDYLLTRVLAGDSLILDPSAPNMDGYECGVWFGKGEFGTQTTQADNSQGSFPYGVYEFQEIRSDTNVGYGLAKFTVKIYQNGVTVEFGTVFDSATDIDTHAFDGKTGIQSGCASRDTLIYDEVSYAGLEAGRQYTLETFIVDAEDGSFLGYTDDEGNFVRFSSKTTFTPADTKGNQRTELRFNGEGLIEGKTITVYQYLYDAEDNLVAYHDYQDDKDEQVTYPLIHTTALSDLTKGHEVSVTENGDVTVVDTVYFENLTPGYNYEVTGVAVDSVTGIEYPQITATETFMPKESKGTVQLTFKFDAKLLEDHKIVFYEKLSYNSQIIAVHEDITDEEQSIYIPKIKTSAKDAVTKEQIADATETVTIEDTVTYSNLVPGTKYEMRGTLMDKETGEPLKVDGKTVTATQEFTPTTPNGTVVLTFTFNGIDMTGKTIVAFEECYRDNKKLCVHTDINDESQTIRFPKLWSNAVFTDSGLKEGKAESPTRLTETFFYENLTPGVEYELVVTPMDYHAQAGIHVPMSGDGQIGVTHLEKRVLFTPESAKGEYTVEFEIDATILAGHTIVMFDTLYRDGKQVAQHQDWEDKEQTLKFVSIGTTLTNKETGDHLGQTIEKLELIDTVAYRNLIPGETYTMKGHLIDAETGETISEEVSVQFSPETENGTVDVPFTIDARELGGHRIVAYERLYRAESEIARHENPNDESQTVRFPEFSTVLHARDNVTLKEVQVSQAAMLTDTIKYTNLVPGYTYKMKGSLVERSSGKTLKDEHGDFVERELMFNPTDPDGEITMDFTFDSSNMAGQYVVAFQELFVIKTDADGNQTEVSLHEAKDLNDPNETIRFVDRPDNPMPTPTPPANPTPTPPSDETPGPKPTPEPDGPWIRTTALDKNTQTHMAEANEKAVIVDTVKYGNLEVGKTYRMEGTLMDKGTGKPVTDAQGNPLKSSTMFTPTDTHGTVEMSFTIDSTTMWGAHLVVFEKCFEIEGTIDDNASPSPDATPVPEKEVAKHEDINDEDQSIYVGRIRTVATVDGGNKATKPSKTTTVVDTVSYENLIPGVTYTMKGSLVDKSTQKAITLANGGTTVEQTFTPDKSSGTVALTFTFDSTGMQNASIVAVEYLYDRNGYLLTYHADMNDEDQTVFINEEGVVPTIQTPDTGVDNNSPILAGTLAVLLAIAVVAVAGLLYKKKRRQNELF